MRNTLRTEIRHLYKPEPVRAARCRWEQDLQNLTRKLSDEDMLLVYLYAERLVLDRINARLQRDRNAAQAGRIAKREIKRIGGATGIRRAS